ncbi:MAG: glycoside hydrolase family 95 protein [Bacteroidales bacterium]
MKKITLLALGFCLGLGANGENLKLRYEQPAKTWMNQALPVGNGYMGAMIYGGVQKDEIQISEESIWSGGPGSSKGYDFGNRKESWKKLPEVRQLLADGKIQEAAVMAEKYFTGYTNPAVDSGEFGDYGSQNPFGSLFISPVVEDTLYLNYERTLDIRNSLATASYNRTGINFNQEYFASYPARLIVARYTNDSKSGLDYRVDFETPHKNLKTSRKGNSLVINGKHASNGLVIDGEILFKTDGKLLQDKEGFLIKGAKNIEAYVSVATDYKNEYPKYRGGDYKATNKKAIQKGKASSFDALKKEHIADYQSLFNRMTFDLGSSASSALPTNERLYRYSQGAYDPEFETLYFQYGRYLLISSSRPGTMPSHLQGKWNDSMTPPWACDYHMNINLQMIYWPAEMANLSECHEPLLQYIDALRAPGRVTAKEYFNARGWSVHTMNNAYGFTAPGWSFNWGYAPNGAAWLCDHLWKHFAFTQDQSYLKDFAYPIMKEVGEFWLDYLWEDKDGTLVSSPSYSPEHGLIAIGSTIDQEIAYDLFTNLLEAGNYLPGEKTFLDSIASARDRLSPLKIGKFGQLQEWKEDLDNPANSHRHVSHLYALYPGKQVSPQLTPKLANAAKRSLVYRGEEGTGWSLGWKINFWARLLDGNQSYKMIRNLLSPALGKGVRFSGAGSYENLFCAHPPFQIDGNLGAVSGIAEMLLQSQHGFLDILPALPAAWPTGSITGLKAVGNYTVDLKWKDGLIREVAIESPAKGECTLLYKGKRLQVVFDAPGKKVIPAEMLFAAF